MASQHKVVTSQCSFVDRGGFTILIVVSKFGIDWDTQTGNFRFDHCIVCLFLCELNIDLLSQEEEEAEEVRPKWVNRRCGWRKKKGSRRKVMYED